MEELTGSDPRRVGPYEILGRLGQGGMGTVYLGRDDAGTRAAVKVIHPDLARDPAFRLRFRREVAVTRRVSGPHIAAVLDAGDGDTDGEQPWLATEYIPAPSLHAVIDEHGALRPDRVRILGAELAEALAMIHTAGLVHRDVKPPNLLLAPTGLRLIDFGIARGDGDTTLTRTGAVMGTPSFMAPEQLRGRREAIAAPADVFALGCVLTFAATATHAFGTGDPDQLHYRIVHEAPHLEGIPHDLRTLIHRCLAKEPADRPTAAELVDVLRAEPITHVAETWAGDAAAEAETSPADPAADEQLVSAATADSAGDDQPVDAGAVADPAGPQPTDFAQVAERTSRRWRIPAAVGAGAIAAVALVVAMLPDSTVGAARGASGASSPTRPAAAGSTSSTGNTSAPLAAPSGVAVSPAGPAPSSPAQAAASSGSTAAGPHSPAASTQPGPTSAPAPPHPTTTTRPGPSSAPPPSATQPPKTTPPAAPPTGLAATTSPPKNTYATISWGSVPGATSYDIQFITTMTPFYRTKSGVVGTSFSDTVYQGDRICFQVRAVNGYGTSAWSPQFCYQN